MRSLLLASAATGLVTLVAPAAALAGDTVLYRDAESWVDVPSLPPESVSEGSPLRLVEQQVRLEDGVVSRYADIAFAIDSSEALNAVNTVSLNWLPDKGDLIVHRVELIRDGQAIDVLEGGAEFEILRREEGLEQRIIDGALTATLSVPGAEIGDVLRYAFTVTRDEQILDDDMEAVNGIIAKPAPLASGRFIMSWPSDVDMKWQAERVEGTIRDEVRGGYRFISLDMPAAEPTEIPGDAPPRFRLAPSVRASTFDSYEEVSAAIQSYFSTEGTIEPGGPLAEKVAEIMAQTSDPLERAALATQFVQDEVSYLLDGLDGGNYIPQSPADTWRARTGDCKAKSLLLLAFLREMNISAEAVLVQTQFGDAVPQLLPALASFDHMIVRADIGGVSYWLDGTNSGLRLSNMVEVPRFRWALPLRPGGAELQEMAMRPQAIPDQEVQLVLDQSAGIDLPAIYDVTIEYTGSMARRFQALSLLEDEEQKEDALSVAVGDVLGEHQPASMTVTFDLPTGVATINARGIVLSPWNTEKPRLELDVPFQVVDSYGVSADRARPEVADLPVSVRGPIYYRRQIEWKLPQDGGEFRLLGLADLDEVIGGTRLASQTELTDGALRIAEEYQSLEWEYAAADLPDIRRRAARLDRALPRLRAPLTALRQWDYRGDLRSRLEPLEALYTQLVDKADDDETTALVNRSLFRFYTSNFEGALADMTAVLAIEPSADNYSSRGAAYWHLGDLEASLADYEAAAEIDPDYVVSYSRIESLSLLGRADEAVAIVDENAYLFEQTADEAQARAYALGFAGRVDEALEVLNEELAIEPENADLLNAVCWYSGIFDAVTDATLDVCTRAVEEAEDSSAATDSRALALLRLGRTEEALRDLDTVLARTPSQHYSRYLRGLVKRAMGQEAEAREDIAAALHARPGIAQLYTAWGLPPG